MNSELWELVKENIAVVAAGLSLITAVLSATIAYFYNVKHKDLDRFYKNAQENMETLIEPIYFKLKDIETIVDKKRKIEILKEFFDSYNYNKINISRLGNRKLIDNFLKSEVAFKKILIDNNEFLYQELILNIKQLKQVVDKDYWKLFEVIYKDYNWYKQTVDMNYILRLLLRLGFFLESTLYGLIFISFTLIIFFVIYSVGISSFDTFIFSVLLTIFLGSICFYLLASVYTTALVDTKQKKNTGDILRENFMSFQYNITKTFSLPIVEIWNVFKYIFYLLRKLIISIISFVKN